MTVDLVCCSWAMGYRYPINCQCRSAVPMTTSLSRLDSLPVDCAKQDLILFSFPFLLYFPTTIAHFNDALSTDTCIETDHSFTSKSHKIITSVGFLQSTDVCWQKLVLLAFPQSRVPKKQSEATLIEERSTGFAVD